MAPISPQTRLNNSAWDPHYTALEHVMPAVPARLNPAWRQVAAPQPAHGSSAESAAVAAVGSYKAHLIYLQDLSRRRAVWLVFASAAFGLSGFLFAGILGYEDIWLNPGTNYLGQPFSSGKHYFPATVSEMVRDPLTASGKCFFAFELIGAICLLMSWYPWELSNVYIGHHRKTILGISWLSIRQFVPPLGMMVVACVTVTPWPQADPSDKVTIFIHCGGAMAMFGSHILCELHALLREGPHQACISRQERALRWMTTLCCAISIAGFCLFQVLLLAAPSWGACCGDVYRMPSRKDVIFVQTGAASGKYDEQYLAFLASQNKKQLYDTAHGTIFLFKMLSYWCEVLQGVFIIYNLLVIWYFCPERHIVLDAELPWAEALEESSGDDDIDCDSWRTCPAKEQPDEEEE